MDTTVSNPIQVLTHADKSAAHEQGARYARNKIETFGIAQDAARTLGTEPTFERWEAYRIEWVAGHVAQNPDVTANAHDQAWATFATLLNTLFGLTKPVSTRPTAEKKRAERDKANETLLAKYEDTPVIELRDKLARTYQAMAQNPTSTELKKAQKELDKVLKLRTSEENKAHGEELKRLRGEVKDKVAKCTDIEKLEAALEILDEYTDLAYTIED